MVYTWAILERQLWAGGNSELVPVETPEYERGNPDFREQIDQSVSVRIRSGVTAFIGNVSFIKCDFL